MNSLLTYIINHKPELITNMIFTLLGTFFGLIFTPNDSNSSRTNTTSISQTTNIINNKISKYEIINYPRNSSQPKTNSNSNDDLIIIFLISVVLLAIYTKYHLLVMEYFLSFTLLGIASTITITIKLYIDNNLDNLNKSWLKLISFIIIVNFIILYLMYDQNIQITNKNIYAIMNVFYYLFGFLICIIPNFFMIIILIHLFSLNSFLVRHGKISWFFLRKTRRFIDQPKTTKIAIIIIIILSLFFSSGIAYKLITKISK